MCQPLGQTGWWGPDLRWWWWEGRERWMVIIPVSIDMLQFTPEISGLKQKTNILSHLMVSVGWTLGRAQPGSLSRQAYHSCSLMMAGAWKAEGLGQWEPSISVSSRGLRASPCGSSTCDSFNFPITWRPFADELQGAWWELNHLLWVSLGSHIVLLTPHCWSIQPEKSSFKRRRHRPTFNGRNVKEFVNIF